MKKAQIRNTRRTVATMANALRKTGLTLSEAWRKAWRRVKKGMTCRAAGVTFENRQQRLAWFKDQGAPLTATLEREPGNEYDSNAIKVILHAGGFRGVVGYINRELARTLAAAIDAECKVIATAAEVIGGYNDKETLGALITIKAE